jgi:putative FmdB family regulatory protein
MPAYEFYCEDHGIFEVVRKMADAGEPAECPQCHQSAQRLYYAAPDIWHCDGAHKTDYGTGNHTGDKRTALNKAWSKFYKEKPPPPAKDVPSNSSDKY